MRQFFGFKNSQERSNKISAALKGVPKSEEHKMVCCDNTKPLFVPLCRSCHSKTNHKREYYEQHFTEMITMKYDGKCYLDKCKIYESV